MFLLVFLFPFGVFADNTNNESDDNIIVSVEGKQYKVPSHAVISAYKIDRYETRDRYLIETDDKRYVLGEFIDESFEYKPNNGNGSLGVSGRDTDSTGSNTGGSSGSSTSAKRREEVVNAFANTGVSPHWGLAVIMVEAGDFLISRRGGEIHLEVKEDDGEWKEVEVPLFTKIPLKREKNENGNKFTIQVIAQKKLTPGKTYRFHIKAKPIFTLISQDNSCWMYSDGFTIRAITEQEKYETHPPYTTLTFDTDGSCEQDDTPGSSGDTAEYCWTFRRLPVGGGTLQYNDITELSETFTGTTAEFEAHLLAETPSIVTESLTKTPGPCSGVQAPGADEDTGGADEPGGDSAVTPPAEGGEEQGAGEGSGENDAPVAEGPGVTLSGTNVTGGSGGASTIANTPPIDAGSLGARFDLGALLSVGGAKRLFELALENNDEAKKLEEAAKALADEENQGPNTDPSFKELTGRGFNAEEIGNAWDAFLKSVSGYLSEYNSSQIIDLAKQGDNIAQKALKEIYKNASTNGELIQEKVIQPLERAENLIDALNRLGPENEEYEYIASQVTNLLKQVNKNTDLLRQQGVAVEQALYSRLETLKGFTSDPSQHIQSLAERLISPVHDFIGKIIGV